ncbi:MAG: O-antigen ligase family protein [Bacteroidetes bacterium]|nr:MAG: O-antigen ligase family protein [Bacteroidota bacterium]
MAGASNATGGRSNSYVCVAKLADVNALLQSWKVQSLTLLFVWMVAMLVSAEFILSLAMIGLVALALFQLRIVGPRVALGWRKTLRQQWRRFLAYRAWLFVSVPFLLVLLSVPWSSDWGYTLERLRIKLPFLVLPFAFASMPTLKKREILAVFYFVQLIVGALALYVLANYLADFEAINEQIGRGQPMPTPSNHIRFSLTVALAILGGIALWKEDFYLSHPRERYFLRALTVFLFVFLHILSVRSGILALYAALFLMGVQQAVQRRQYWQGLALVAGLCLVPLLAYKTLPSFQTKIHYALWDLQQYAQGKGGTYSDSERLTSLKIGWAVVREHFWFGTGAGDLKAEMQRRYAEAFPEGYSFRMPHNQFLSVWAGTGLVGLLLFVIGFFQPLLYRKNYAQPLFLGLHALIFVSFMMENTIENNFGVSLFLFYLLIGLNYFSGQSRETAPRKEVGGLGKRVVGEGSPSAG